MRTKTPDPSTVRSTVIRLRVTRRQKLDCSKEKPEKQAVSLSVSTSD